MALIGAYLLVAQLRRASEVSADQRSRNAEVLNRAKQALIGYVAQRAAAAGEDNPGRLPCPEHPAYIGDPSREGTAGPGVAVPSPACSLVGRLPWRTLGLDKLVDASNEPLWYVVSPQKWSLQLSSTLLTINSNTPGSLTVDGTPNAAVALIIAPGPTMNVQAAAGCAARVQTRTATPPDPLDYIECFNTAASSFTSSGPSTSFNDQVVRVTVADVMPEIEAAIADRIRREIVPELKGIYASAQWGLTGANPMFPFASPFANPGPGGGSSSYKGEYDTSDPGHCPGTLSRCQGLLPLTYSPAAGCSGGDPRCSTGFVDWRGTAPTMDVSNGMLSSAPSCSISGTVARCTGRYRGLVSTPVQLRMTARADNVAMALKALSPTGTGVQYGQFFLGTASPGTVSATFNTDGSANVTITGSVPGYDNFLPLGVDAFYRVTADIGSGVLVDHPFLNATTHPTYGWFWRNEWYRLLYYAPALAHTSAGAPTPSCTTGLNCLSVTNIAPAGKQRAILILTGRNIKSNPPATRPSGNIGDYLEFGNADGNTTFEQQPISNVVNPALKAPFNDRIIVLDANP